MAFPYLYVHEMTSTLDRLKVVDIFIIMSPPKNLCYQLSLSTIIGCLCIKWIFEL